METMKSLYTVPSWNLKLGADYPNYKIILHNVRSEWFFQFQFGISIHQIIFFKLDIYFTRWKSFT